MTARIQDFNGRQLVYLHVVIFIIGLVNFIHVQLSFKFESFHLLYYLHFLKRKLPPISSSFSSRNIHWRIGFIKSDWDATRALIGIKRIVLYYTGKPIENRNILKLSYKDINRTFYQFTDIVTQLGSWENTWKAFKSPPPPPLTRELQTFLMFFQHPA